MTSARRVGIPERRARLAHRHHLVPSQQGDDVTVVARDLVALHATDPATVFLSAAARLRQPEVARVEASLYDERTLLRMLGMRRTMFVVTDEVAPVVHAACTTAIEAREWRRTVKALEQAGMAEDGDAWLRVVTEEALQALRARGASTAVELSADVPQLRTQIPVGVGTKWAGTWSVSTRVLFLLAAGGQVVRGRPRGSWISSQYRWAPMDSWVAGGLAEYPVEAAQAELVRLWLRAFGPGTAADLKWWTGWTLREVRRALAAVGPVEVALDGESLPGLVLAEDVAPVVAPDPWVALLPALDPTVMGWKARQWYLGEHGPTLFDRSGNPGPTVWCDGRIVGGWAQRPDGEIAHRLFADIGAAATRAVAAEAERLRIWHGAIRVTPRFRTPLERELTA